MVLTEKLVAKLVPGKQRIQLLDDDVTGFGVRVESVANGGRISFYWRAKINGSQVFRALGEIPSTSVKDARTKALELAGKAAEWKRSGYAGDNPFEKRKRQETVTVPTFRELVEAYIVHHVRANANRPADAEYDVRWIVKKRFGGWLDRNIDQVGVEDMLTVKNGCGEKRHSANRAIEFIRALFNWSSDTTDTKINFWKVENPASKVECFPEKPRVRILHGDELVRFNDALKNEPHADLKDFLVLAVATAARRSDIFGMRWEDIRWERACWTVPHPKNGQAYDVQLLPVALEVLKRRRAAIAETEPHVFPGVGKTGHLRDLKKPWNEFRKRAELSNYRLHDNRHLAASFMAMSGASLLEIQRALGHKSLQSTQVYAHLLDESVRDAREAGQSKMLSMMRAAKRRGRLATSKKKPTIALTA